MSYELSRIDPGQAARRAGELAAGLVANRGVSDLLGYGLGVVGRRLQRNRLDYLRHGPYWWALKEQLRAAGQDVGDYTDATLAEVYRGETPVITLVMADAFRERMMSSRPVGARDFDLSEGEPVYILFDPDMEDKA